MTAPDTQAAIRRAQAWLADAAKLRDAKAALEPFAQYALVTDEYTSGASASDAAPVLEANSPVLKKTVRVGDFRKARTALAKLREEATE